jgi:hypothetical protein
LSKTKGALLKSFSVVEEEEEAEEGIGNDAVRFISLLLLLSVASVAVDVVFLTMGTR